MSQGALAGLKIIDCTRVLGGPYCTQVLADMGAEVIKIEPPQGDEVRHWGPPFKDGLSAYFSGVNRNKRSLALDLSRPEGRDVLVRLLDGADVLIENFKAGTMEKWGLGYDGFLAERFPRLIHCAITGFGTDGPFGGLPGYDAVIQAWAGWISVNGSQDSGPMRVGVPLVDMGTGLYAAIGILAAITERHASGKGQFIDVTLYDCAIALLHPHAPNYLMSGKPPGLTGNAHPNISPYDLYQTKGRALFLGVGNDRQFHRLCTLLGAPELADDPRFANNAERMANRPALTEALQLLLAEHDGEAIATLLIEAGVPAGAAQNIPDLAAHPHTAHRKMMVEKDGYRGTGIPLKMSRTPGEVRSKPPLFGQDGAAVLGEAGYSAAEIAELFATGIALKEPKV